MKLYKFYTAILSIAMLIGSIEASQATSPSQRQLVKEPGKRRLSLDPSKLHSAKRRASLDVSKKLNNSKQMLTQTILLETEGIKNEQIADSSTDSLPKLYQKKDTSFNSLQSKQSSEDQPLTPCLTDPNFTFPRDESYPEQDSFSSASSISALPAQEELLNFAPRPSIDFSETQVFESSQKTNSPATSTEPSPNKSISSQTTSPTKKLLNPATLASVATATVALLTIASNKKKSEPVMIKRSMTVDPTGAGGVAELIKIGVYSVGAIIVGYKINSFLYGNTVKKKEFDDLRAEFDQEKDKSAFLEKRLYRVTQETNEIITNITQLKEAVRAGQIKRGQIIENVNQLKKDMKRLKAVSQETILAFNELLDDLDNETVQHLEQDSSLENSAQPLPELKNDEEAISNQERLAQIEETHFEPKEKPRKCCC